MFSVFLHVKFEDKEETLHYIRFVKRILERERRKIDNKFHDSYGVSVKICSQVSNSDYNLVWIQRASDDCHF